MALEDAIGGYPDFSPEAAVDDLIRKQAADLPPSGSLSPDILANRLYRKMNQPRPQEPSPIEQPAARAPAADAKAPDFSSQGVPADQLPDFSDQGVPADAAATPAAPAPVPAPAASSTSTVGTYAKEFGKGVLEGGKNMGASALKGTAALSIPTPADPAFLDELAGAKDLSPSQMAKLQGRVIRGISDRGLQMDYIAALRRVSQGADPAAEVEGLRSKFGINNTAASTPVTESKLYKAGQAVEGFGKEALAPAPGFEHSWTRDIGSGAGSMAAGILTSMIPGIGPAAAGTLFTTGGMGEATDNAVKGGATPQQTRQAALLGGVAGATDMVDTLLPMLGSTGKAVGFIKRMGVAAVKGALMEGGQEGVQQLMQNAIAKGIYKPDQDMFEDVPRSVAIAAILGGVGGGLSGAVGDRRSAPAPSPTATAPGPGATAGGPSPGPSPGPTPGAAPGAGAGPQSSPEDIADFVRRAKEGAPPPPQPDWTAPDPSAMSDKERMDAFTAARESHSGASETEILKATGLSDDEIKAMKPEERVDAVIRATKKPEAASGAQAEQEAEPQAQPEQDDGYSTLREYGYSDEDIDNMSPRQRAREVKDALDSGIDPVAAATKHQRPAAGTREEPIKPATAEDVQRAQPALPTPAQAKAENYKHAHIELPHLGLEGSRSISVETGVGQERSGTDADGKPWSVKLEHAAYGRIKGTKGADGQALDIFVGPHPTSPHVFVVDQHHPGAGFDEHKIMAGFRTPIDAMHAYANAYTDGGKDRIGGITALTPEQFKAWLQSGNTVKPLGGKQRFYHGHKGGNPAEGGARWITPHEQYARDFRTDGGTPNDVSYVDISRHALRTHPELAGGYDEVNDNFRHFEAPERIAKQLRPLKKGEPVSDTHRSETGSGSPLTEAPAQNSDVPKVSPTPGAGAGVPTTATQNNVESSGQSDEKKRGTPNELRPNRNVGKSTDRPLSLLQFLAENGGLKPHGDLEAMDAHRHRVQIPGRKGFFGLVKTTGLPLDMAREAAEEAGYLRGEGHATSTERDLLDAIDKELRGTKLHAEGEEGTKTKADLTREDEAHAADRDAEIRHARDDIAAEYADLPEDLLDLAATAMVDESLDIDSAVEVAAMRLVTEDDDYAVTEDDITRTYGEGASDAIRPEPASETGGPTARAVEEEHGPGEGKEAEPAGERVPAAGAQSEQTEAGEQAVIPGTEAIGQGEQAQRAIDKPLKPAAPQKPADEGLFGDSMDQADLLDQIEKTLGTDADKVAPVDIARAAEIMADNPGMEPATAFGQAVIENAVEQGFITEQEAKEAYGEDVKEVLDAGRQGAPVGGEQLEQGGATSGEVGAGGAAEAGVVPGRGETGGQGEAGADAADRVEPDAGRETAGAAAEQGASAAEDADQPGVRAGDWWRHELSGFGREQVVDAAHVPFGVAKTAWHNISPENQAKLAAIHGTDHDPIMRREAPTWAQILAELPMLEKSKDSGRAFRDTKVAFDLMTEITGDPSPKYENLTPTQKGQLLDTLRGKPDEPTLKPEENADGVQAPVHAGDATAGAEDVQPVDPGRNAGGVREPEGGGSQPDVRGIDEGRSEGAGRVPEGAGGERSDRSRDGGADRVSGARDDDAADRRAKRDAKRAADRVGENFVIEPGALDEGRGQMAKARDNIHAIETLLKIEAEARAATAAEQATLAQYVGWGGIKNIFPDAEGKMSPEFEALGNKLADLLTPTEYDTARRSIQYAHYTSEDIVRSMWGAVARMGFDGGQVFEPGMGVGNFAGMMPPDIAAKTSYAGVELDHVTARIAKLLYPKWGVRQDDFTKTNLPADNYDLVIGNPPFADVPIKSDPKYKQGFLLHDYFFAKSIDAVRPGGLLAFVTSAGTMNKLDTVARDYIADRADLVGAIRLPGDAFKKNAGTEVTTDIIFLRKRLPGDVMGDRTWTETTQATLPNKNGMQITGNVNRYFAEHPEMVLGEQGFFDKLYQNRYAVRSRKDADIKADIEAAIATLPADVMSPWQNVNADHAEQDFNTTEKKEGTFYIGPNGMLHQVSSGTGRPVQQRGKGVENGKTAAEIERIKALIPVRDSLREVYAADLKGDTANADRAREALNRSYDAFVEKFGPINKSVIQTRRPNVIQMEAARAEAREEARYEGREFKEGTFDASDMLDAKVPISVIARERAAARKKAADSYLNFDEGEFDEDEVPNIIIDKRPNVDPFMDDPESYRLRAIERYDEGTDKGYKSPVFTENVISRERVPEINSVNDALLYSLSQYGRVNVPEMSRLAKKSEAEVIEALGEQVFRQPGTSDVYLTRDEYLSGNVRKKLEIAQTAAERNPDFRRNVTALEAAQPIPLAPSQIHASLGMPWIPAATVKEFGLQHLGLEKLNVQYVQKLATWLVSGDTDSVAASTTWGTADRRAPALLQDALNRQNPKIFDKYRDTEGREQSQLNIVKTEAAQDKVRAMQEAFAGWIWSDTPRADKLAGFYNDNYNNLVVREYNGDYLTTPGIASSWSWRPHQKRVIARIIQSGNTYVAHAVGGGKTSEYIGAIMEMRRLGLVRKPMIAVPNHMLAQFTKEFYEQYPTARLAIADDKRFHTDKRKQFIANVAMEDLDAIIITHSSFGMIPVSARFSNGIIQREIDQYRALMAQLSGGENRITRSRVEKQIERLQQRLEGKGTKRKDSVFTFEEMGVDHLTVDEAHLFRKLDFSTNMSNLKGVSPEGSGMAWDLYVKAQYLDSIRPGRGLVLGSGTPITNTMAELYTLSRYMQPQVLAERGLEKFDAWAGAFGESVSELEQDAAGNYKAVSRFAKFVNVAELSAMVRQVMDVVTSRQLEQYVTRPQIAGGKRKLHLAEKSAELTRFQEQLARRMKAIQERKGPPKKGDDIMLSVINDGRHAAIDMRLAGGRASNIPSKLDMMVDNIYKTWASTKKAKFYKPAQGGGYESTPSFTGPATQLAFTNLGLSGARGFSVPDYIRMELVRRGVPKNEIAYIYDYKSSTAKQRLFNDMNEGKVRILIGSVAKMGVGTNVQRRLIAIHNQDPLWYPADDEQRNGRGIRQGNMNREIEINDYAAKGTYDSTMWGMMEKKARFIQGFFEGDPSMRDMDDLGEASQYEQAKAMTTNDPRLIRFTELKQELEKATRRKQSFESEAYATRQRRARSASEAEHYTKRIADTQKDIAQRVDTTGDNFKAKIDKATFDSRTEFGEALFNKIEQIETIGKLGAAMKVAEIGGFSVYATPRKGFADKDSVTSDVFIQLNGEMSRDVSYGVSPLGTVRSIEATLRSLDNDLEEYKQRKAKAEKFFAESEVKAKAKFEGNAEIAALTQQVNEMAAELAKPIEQPAAPEAEVNDEEGEESLASAIHRADLSKTAEANIPKIEALLRQIVERLTGGFKTEFTRGAIPLGQTHKGYGDIEVSGARGVYLLKKALIKLALIGTDEDVAKAAYHESYHAIEDRLQTDDERELMKAETPRLRESLKRNAALLKRLNLKPEQIDQLAGYEVRAMAFEEYAFERASKAANKSGDGMHVGVRRWFERLWQALRQLANGLRGLGFQTHEDIFSDAFKGEYAGRQESYSNNIDADSLASAIFDGVGERVSRVAGRLGFDPTELRTQLQDKFIRVRHAERSVGAVPASQSAYQAESLYYGRTGEQLEKLEKEEFDPLIKDLKARGIGLEDINEYLYAKHAPERNRAMDAINHPNLDVGGRDLRGRGSGMSDDEAQAVMDRITAAGKMADYEAVERRIRKIIDDTRNGLVDSGLISQDTADAWASAYEFYVPLRGFDEGAEDETFSGRGQGFDTRARESQQAFGRLSKAAGPLPYIMMQAETAIVRGEKNKVGNAWLRFVRAHPDRERWTVDTPPTRKSIDRRTGLVTTVEDHNWHLRPDVFVTKVGGKPTLIMMPGRDGANLVRALKNMGTSNLNSVLRFMHAITSTMSRLATQWNPNFIVPNFARDVGEAFINLQAQDQQNFVKNFAKHLFPAIGGSFNALRGATGGRYAAAFREFDQAGGRIRFFGLENVEDVEKNVRGKLRRLEGGAINNLRDAGKKAADGFEVVNGAIENATRLAAYMAARDVGMTVPDAAMLARNLTVDFNKKGELGSAINALYMFANASLQGTVRMGTALSNKRVRWAAFGLVTIGALSAMFNFGAGGDDDGEASYGKIKPYIRDKNFIVMWPKGMGHDGQYFKVPLPYGFSPFKVLGDRLAGVVMGKDKPGAAMWAVLSSIADAFNPLGEESASVLSLIPSAFRPAAHIQVNKNWTGNPLYPEHDYDKNKPDSEKSFRSNSTFSKEAARVINKMTGGNPYKAGWADWHPGSIDHVLESLTGGLGKFVGDVIHTGGAIYRGDPFDVTKAPVIRRFYGTTKDAQTDAGSYYEARDEARKNGGDAIKQARKDRASGVNKEEAESFLRGNTNSVRGEQIFKGADEQLKPLRERQRRIEANTDMPAETRRKELEAVTERMREIQNRARRQYRDMKAGASPP